MLMMMIYLNHSRIGDRMLWRCKILILPKSNQICTNLITVLFSNFASLLSKSDYFWPNVA